MSTLKTNNIQHVDLAEPSILLNSDGSVSIAGTVSYEDATNVDSVGVVTARKQLHVGTGVSVKAGGLNVTAGITTLQAVTGTTAAFSGDVSIADKIIHTGDTDTAIRFPSANVISFEAGGSESFRVDTSGKLLVGQTGDSDGQICMAGVLAFSGGGGGTPSGANVRPNISRGTNGQLILASGKDSGSTIRFDVAADASTNAAQVALIDSSGNLMLGTSTSIQKFTIDGGGISLDNGWNTQWGVNASRAYIQGEDGNGNNRLILGTSNTERLRIDSSGRLLLGTTTEGYGDADNLTIRDSGNCGITIRSGTSNYGSVFFSDATSGSGEYDGFVQYDHSNQKLTFGAAAAGAPKLSINSSGNANFTGIVTATQFAPSTVQSSHKNIIINGDMRIAQRATTHGSSGYRTVDRFKMNAGGANTTLTQEQVDVAAGTSPYVRGFRKAFKITNAGQNANNAGYVYMQYQVEAQDIATSGWRYLYDTSADDHLSLSFWIKASVSQNYLFFYHTNDGTIKEFSHLISLTAGTWTKVSITVPGNSGITINNDNGVGLNLYWTAYLGSDYTATGTVDQWVTHAGYTSRPDMPNTWWTTSNATIELTGVQLEVGKESSAFEHRLLSEELARCQRYYFKIVDGDSTSETIGFSGMVWQQNNGSIVSIRYPVKMRAVPALEVTNGTQYWRHFSGNDLSNAYSDGSGIVSNLTRTYAAEIYVNVSANTGAEGRGVFIRGNNTAAKMAFKAELS